MISKWFISLFFLVVGFSVCGQITSVPELPTASEKITITFDSSKESRLGYYTGDLYAHTGLITDQSASDTDWKYVIESWGNNTTQPKLTNKGNGIYELVIAPDIYTYYNVPKEEKVLKLEFVFHRPIHKNKPTIYMLMSAVY